MSLLKYRKKIDKIDNKIIKLLKKRQDLSKKIARYKKQRNLQILDPKRELIIFKNLEQKAIKNNLDKKYIKEVFEKIIEDSRKIQENIKVS